jgi:hypothetical protein
LRPITLFCAAARIFLLTKGYGYGKRGVYKPNIKPNIRRKDMSQEKMPVGTMRRAADLCKPLCFEQAIVPFRHSEQGIGAWGHMTRGGNVVFVPAQDLRELSEIFEKHSPRGNCQTRISRMLPQALGIIDALEGEKWCTQPAAA